MSESVDDAGGLVWLTFGGLRWLAQQGQPPTAANRSEVVAFDPKTKKFCTYLVPGNDNEVTGVAVTGTGAGTRVWYTESNGVGGRPSLDAFNPSSLDDGWDGRANEAVALPASVRLLTWPTSGPGYPAQIAVDPTSDSLWITDFNGSSVNGVVYADIERVDISDPAHPAVTNRYPIRSSNADSFLGPKPWEILAPPHSNYVYASDNGDAEIVRINKVTGRVDEVPIPLGSDLENGFGLALSSGRLYFTLSDDYAWGYGDASTFGYIPLSSWRSGSAPTHAVMYSGLPQMTNHSSTANYRAMAAGRAGDLVITDQHSVVRLTP
jgi:DNA-binding beta-propeller fold protein YncE